MAITRVGFQAATYVTTASITFASVVNHSPDDLIVIYIATKPDTVAPTTPSGYTLIGSAAGGGGTTGVDAGPTAVYLYYRIATGTGTAADLPGSSTITGNNVSAWGTIAYRRAAGTTWDIAGVGAADSTTGTPHTVTMSTNPGLTVGDYIFTIGVIPTDVTTPSQFSAQTVAATGLTTVSLTEIAEIDTTAGNDMGGWLADGAVVTGTSTAAPTVSATAGGTTTNVRGPIFIARIREVTPTIKSASDSGSLALSTESAVVTPVAYPTLRGTPQFNEIGRLDEGNTTVTVTVEPNDVIVVKTISESTPMATISGGGLTWTQRASITGSSTAAGARIHTAIATTSGNITITGVWTVNNIKRSMLAEVWQNAKLDATPVAVATDAGGSAPSHTITTEANYSIVSWLNGDFNAVAGTNAYRSSAIEEVVTGISGTDYVATYAYQQAANAGSQTYGLTAPTGQDPTMIAIEVQYEASNNTPVSANDSGALTLSSEISSTSIQDSRADSGTISATESITASVQSAATDSGVISVTESVVITASQSVADSGLIGASEQIAVVVLVSATDSGAMAAVESTSSALTATLTDSGQILSTESASNSISVNLVDSGALGSTESAQQLATQQAADSGTISATEEVDIATNIEISDGGPLVSTEEITATVGTSLSETGLLSSAESASVVLSQELEDSQAISAVETISVEVINQTNIADSGLISSSESATVSSSQTASDSGTIAASEDVTIFKEIALVDSGVLLSSESSATTVAILASDSGSLTVEETSNTEIAGVVEKTSSDQGQLFSQEDISITPNYLVEEVSTLSSTESATVIVSSPASDTGTVGAVEEISVLKAFSTTDEGMLAITESASVVVITGFAVDVWDGTQFIVGTIKVWNGTAFVDPVSVTKWNGAAFEPL